MKVILLAAGQSTRVKPIEDKNFVKICGRYLIEHQLLALDKAGLKEIFLIVNKYNLAAFEELVAKLNQELPEISITPVEQQDLEAGMAGAILACKDFLRLEEQILVTSSNDVVDPQVYKTMLDKSVDTTASSLLLAKEVEEYFPGGYLEIKKEPGKLTVKKIIEKPEPGKEPSNLVNIVVHWHKKSRQLIEFLEKTSSKEDDRYEQAISQMIKSGVEVEAVPYSGFWQPVKYPWHLFPLFDYFFKLMPKKISKKALISKKAVIKGDVVIEDGVKVFEGAVINGPCYLGEKTIVANNALVRHSNVEANSVIGFSTEVARSIVGENSWFHSNYIGDSIIGENCAFGAGAVTGNLRLDEQNIHLLIKDKKIDSGTNKLGVIMGNNVRIGINTSLMPGIRIGSNSFIGSGIIIGEDIPEKSFVKGETTLKITQNKTQIAEGKRAEMRGKI